MLAAAQAEGKPDPEAVSTVQAELSKLRAQFAGTPYPPTASAGSAVALAKLVGRVEWAAGNAAVLDDGPAARQIPHVQAMIETAAETLRQCAALICDQQAHPVDDPEGVRALRESMQKLDDLMGHELAAEVSTLIASDGTLGAHVLGAESGAPGDGRMEGLASSLDPSFSARAFGIATLMVADTTIEAAGVHPEGEQKWSAGIDAGALEVWPRLVSHLSFRSVWFRNAVRGAAGLALAVAVVEITDVEHGFWVVLGTLSVLRSNALGTGATALRAIGGTAVGFVIGAALTIGVGSHPVALWALLPLAVLVAGVAPSMISFAAGQAGFTLVVIILFNIIQPTGWKVGLTRIEDVAIGCGVSVVVGLLFWPRGALAALGKGAVRRIRHELQLPRRCGGSFDQPERCGGHDPGSAGVEYRLPQARRRLSAVPGRTRGEGRAGGGRGQSLHRFESDPVGCVHAVVLAAAPPGWGRTRTRVGRGCRRGAPGLVRREPSLVRRVRRGAERAARRDGPSHPTTTRHCTACCGRPSRMHASVAARTSYAPCCR